MTPAQKKALLLIHNPLKVTGGMERFNFYLKNFLETEGYAVNVFDQTSVSVPHFVNRYLNPWVIYRVGKNTAVNEYDLIMTVGFAGGWIQHPRAFNICFGTVQSYLKSIEAWTQHKKTLIWEMLWSLFLDRLGKKHQSCLATSLQVKKELWDDYRVPSVVVPCGVDVNHFTFKPSGRTKLRQQLGISSEQLVGAFVGRWAPMHKGLDTLLSIMEQRSDIHWIIATDGNPNLDQVARKSVLKNVSYADLPDFYSCADFSIQLSRYESYGFSFVESLACGTPVISTPVGITPEIYDEPLFKPLLIEHPAKKRIGEIHSAIDHLSDENFRNQIRQAVQPKIASQYSIEAWQSHLREMINPRLTQ